MEYIVTDLEWDSVYFPPEKRFINQILQIGAVKLNDNFEVIDSLDIIVRSEISNKVTGRFAKLTGITSEIMRSGISFIDAVEQYNKFVLNADVTMTWSDSDLYTILENEDFRLKNGPKFKFSKYLDLQKFVQMELYKRGYESKNQIALEAAADFLGLNTEGFEFHTAVDDCKVSAELFKISFDKARFDSLVKDTTDKTFYKRLRFKPYPISDINDSDIKPSELEFACPECGGKTKRITNWKYKNRWFMSNFKCDNCSFKFNGRVAFKRTFDEVKVKHKVCEYKPKKRNTNDMQSMSEKV